MFVYSYFQNLIANTLTKYKPSNFDKCLKPNLKWAPKNNSKGSCICYQIIDGKYLVTSYTEM